MAADSKGVRATTHVLALRETFQIARGAADEETVVVAELESRRGRRAWRGCARGLLGRDARGHGARRSRPTAPRCSATTCSPARRSCARVAAWDGPQGAKMALDGVVHDWLGRRVGQPLWRLLGTDRVTPPTSFTIGIDSVEGTADRTRRATGYEVLKIKVGGPGDLERLRAVRAETDARLRIDGNEGWDLETARCADAGADRARRRVRRAAVPGGRSRCVPRVPRAVAAAAGADRRGLPRPRVGRADRGVRRRDRDQALQVRRDPRGAADDPCGAGARPAGHARLHDRVRAGDRAGRATRVAGRPHRPRRAPADLLAAVRGAGAGGRAARALRRPRAGRGAGRMADRLALFTGGAFADSHAKTAHGILRYGDARGGRGRGCRVGRRQPPPRSCPTRGASTPIVALDRGGRGARRERAGDRRGAVRRRADRRVARGAAGGDRLRAAPGSGAAHGAGRGRGTRRGGFAGRRRAARPARGAARAERPRGRAPGRARSSTPSAATARSGRCR